MRKIGWTKALACVLILAISGCSSNNVKISSKPRSRRTQTEVTTSAGTYKIGNPYKIAGVWYTPHEDFSYKETGEASWYGADFHNGSTANGEKYNMHAMTAAHRTLPLPSIVRVTNLKNGKSVILRVNDRGPFAKDRIIDVSRLAAQKLDFLNQGTTRVRVEILPEESRKLRDAILAGSKSKASTVNVVSSSKLEPTQKKVAGGKNLSGVKGRFVQVGAFSNKENAEKVRRDIEALGAASLFQSGVGETGRLYRVRIGPFTTQSEAEEILKKVKGVGYPNAKIVEDK